MDGFSVGRSVQVLKRAEKEKEKEKENKCIEHVNMEGIHPPIN